MTAVAATWMVVLLVSSAWVGTAAQALVSGVVIFGDSVVDAGNNNRLPTLVCADFSSYGHDFLATPTAWAAQRRLPAGVLVVAARRLLVTREMLC
ncbi:hypothetical protein E2562_000184 [Oryza meyeriana var. granulata]|uniref:Uncharacterized protein n=1 Tax=Oryza meyeriana var. granulata TaxID=110450 RepID=A0A6G1DC50_9ORYZ|nr:hypothetical protein E2562_000184 [Oryza meyeriana var. granulata]